MKDTEAKASFFAQYWGQRVFMHPDYFNRMSGSTNTKPRLIDTTRILYNWVSKGYLLLRSVEQLTDEELININDNIFNCSTEKHGSNLETKVKNTVTAIFEDDFEVLYEGNFNAVGIFELAQYLLRIGILLPFTYLDEAGNPVTLHPSEIIDRGWAKYKL